MSIGALILEDEPGFLARFTEAVRSNARLHCSTRWPTAAARWPRCAQALASIEAGATGAC